MFLRPKRFFLLFLALTGYVASAQDNLSQKFHLTFTRSAHYKPYPDDSLEIVLSRKDFDSVAFIRSVSTLDRNGGNKIKKRMIEKLLPWSELQSAQVQLEYVKTSAEYFTDYILSVDTAQQFLDQAKKILASYSNPYLELVILRTQAHLFMFTDKFDQSLEYLQAALKLSDSIGAEHYRGLCYQSLGHLYRRIADYNSAVEPLLKSIDIFQKMEMTEDELSSIMELTNVYYYQKEYAKVFEMDKLLVERCRALGLQRRLAFALTNLGEDYFQQDEFEKAIECYKESVRLKKKLDTDAYLFSSYIGLLRVYGGLRQFNRAQLYIDSAKTIALKRTLEMKRDLYTYIFDLDTLRGDYRQALESFQMKTLYQDSLFEKEKVNRISELQTKYETAKKESENQQLLKANAQQEQLNWILGGGGALLLVVLSLLAHSFHSKQKANRRLEIQKQQIESSLREKESLLREIHHRVKNNLQVISSLLNMQAYHIDDPRMISVVAEGQNRVKAMSLIHQKLYQTDQLSEIDFEEYTEQLTTHLAAAFGDPGRNIKSVVSGSNLKLDIDTAIPLGLILNELITNAYKYAFNGLDDGVLKIDLKLDTESYYHLRITDSGKGLPDDFNESQLNSLGLKLVRMLVEQLDGSLAISNEQGAHFHIRFKKQQIAA